MRKSRFTDEQIVGFLKQAEAGLPVKELCRKGGFSDVIPSCAITRTPPRRTAEQHPHHGFS
jgi:Transposase